MRAQGRLYERNGIYPGHWWNERHSKRKRQMSKDLVGLSRGWSIRGGNKFWRREVVNSPKVKENIRWYKWKDTLKPVHRHQLRGISKAFTGVKYYVNLKYMSYEMEVVLSIEKNFSCVCEIFSFLSKMSMVLSLLPSLNKTKE